MLSRLLILIVVINDVNNVSSHNTTAESSPALLRLYRHLLNGYIRFRPRINSSQPVTVSFILNLSSIDNLDGRSGTITLYGYFNHEWTDDYLTWDPAMFDDVTHVQLSVRNIWRPDVGVVNSRGSYIGNFFQSIEEFSCRIGPDGHVHWGYNALVEASCGMDMFFFPFDQQTCTVYYGTLNSQADEVDIRPAVSHIGQGNFVENGQYELISNSSYYQSFQYGDAKFSAVALQFVIARRPVHYLLNMIGPCVALSLLALLAFCLPVASGERISLQVTVMLSFSIYQTMLAEFIPIDGQRMPIISIQIVATMLLCGVSLVSNVLVLNVYAKSPSVRISPRMHSFMFGLLGKIVCYQQRPRLVSPSKSMQATPMATGNLVEIPEHPIDSVCDGHGPEGLGNNNKDQTHVILHESRESPQVWQAVADILDRIFLCIFCTIFLICAVIPFVMAS